MTVNIPMLYRERLWRIWRMTIEYTKPNFMHHKDLEYNIDFEAYVATYMESSA